jgi:hypothetical protein
MSHNPNPNNINLGDVVYCRVYNLVGIVISSSIHYNGVVQFEIMPKVKEGEIPDSRFLDGPGVAHHNDLEIHPLVPLIPKCLIDILPNDEVEDRALNIRGIVIEIVTDIAGNMFALLGVDSDLKHHYCPYQRLTATGVRIKPSRTETGCMSIKTAVNL